MNQIHLLLEQIPPFGFIPPALVVDLLQIAERVSKVSLKDLEDRLRIQQKLAKEMDLSGIPGFLYDYFRQIMNINDYERLGKLLNEIGQGKKCQRDPKITIGIDLHEFRCLCLVLMTALCSEIKPNK